MTTTTDTREAKLLAVAAHHAWELEGVSTILWPKSQRGLAVLREAWELIRPAAQRGELVGALAPLNYRPDRRPYAAHVWPGEDEAA